MEGRTVLCSGPDSSNETSRSREAVAGRGRQAEQREQGSKVRKGKVAI